jgi:hypothetical protein
MAGMKTKPGKESVDDFLNNIEDEKKRQDSYVILNLMKQTTQAEPKLWGGNMVGFGKYSYKYASGHSGEWFLTGFAPRKKNLTLYIMSGFDDYETLMGKLGKYKTGKSCLYINKVEDIDLIVLGELVERSVAHMIKTNP